MDGVGTIIFVNGEQYTGEWSHLYWKLFDKHHDEGYNKMIGNIPYLTEFNNKQKGTFKIYIPL